MSDKVKRYLILDGIGIAINTFFMIVLCHLCSYVPYDIVTTILNIIIVTVSVTIDLGIVFFFLLYWWSDIKWTKCKNKAKNLKHKFYK